MRRFVARRHPVFLGCEGESERAYCQVLSDIVRRRIESLHFEVVLIGEGAGNVITKVKKAVKKIKDYEKKRSTFWKKAILIDDDIATGADKGNAETLGRENGIKIIWQSPCYEAFLLRHLPNCSTLRPPSGALAKSRLVAEVPTYMKPMTRIQTARVVRESSLMQAITVEAELAAFLSDIGWS